jgi:hypothetical protein
MGRLDMLELKRGVRLRRGEGRILRPASIKPRYCIVHSARLGFDIQRIDLAS